MEIDALASGCYQHRCKRGSGDSGMDMDAEEWDALEHEPMRHAAMDVLGTGAGR